MAYDEPVDGNGSKFNAGIYQTQRVHTILMEINRCKTKPEAFNMEYQDWNYSIWFNSIDALFDELEGWLKDEESKECTDASKTIQDCMESNKIHDVITNLSSKGGQLGINRERLLSFKRALRGYERFVRRLGIKYKIIAVTADSDMDGL
jgi:IS1 family transposase